MSRYPTKCYYCDGELEYIEDTPNDFYKCKKCKGKWIAEDP